MNFGGIFLGIISFLVIGVWHKIVISGEYHLGKNCCVVLFIVTGVICVLLSLLFDNLMISVALALFGFSALWGIHEVIEQEKRVEKGWFPANPRRNKKS